MEGMTLSCMFPLFVEGTPLSFTFSLSVYCTYFREIDIYPSIALSLSDSLSVRLSLSLMNDLENSSRQEPFSERVA